MGKLGMRSRMVGGAGMALALGLIILLPTSANAVGWDTGTKTCTATTRASVTSTLAGSYNINHNYSGFSNTAKTIPYNWDKFWAASSGTRTSYSGMYHGNGRVTASVAFSASSNCYSIN